MLKYIGTLTFLIFSSPLAEAKNVTYQELIKKDFAHCKLEKKIDYLTKDQVKKIEKHVGGRIYSQIVMRYVANCPEGKKNVFVDSHIVRTMNETVVVTVDENKIKDYKIASFMEPMEYKPNKAWLSQVKNKTMNSKMNLYKEIDGISGATLSARATVKAAKKVLVLDKILQESIKQ